ncbi:MAG: PucR family transcriptional regulator [Thermoleophilaceae bacterium]
MAAQKPSGAARAPATRVAAAALDEVADALESGAGLPTVARAAGRALEASVIVLDSSSSVLAVACASSDEEHAVMSGESGSVSQELRVAGAVVGELRFRPRGEGPDPALLRTVATLIGQEVERSKAPERASEAAVADFIEDVLGRRVTDRENIVARAAELGSDLSAGAGVVVARARPQQPEAGDWRARVLAVAERGARGVERTALAGLVRVPHAQPQGPEPELVVVLPAAESFRRAADAVLRELESAFPNHVLAVALSRQAGDPADLHRAGAEALLAANVAEARGLPLVSFEETGAYRLLLPAMSEDPAELRGFHGETIAPLLAYDEEYETELVRTLETFLDLDANVAKTAERLFTHRHTIRYRLERVRELTGFDVSSTEGRERLSLGLKAMRVLGIVAPGGPATEPGAGAGRVPKEEKDR